MSMPAFTIPDTINSDLETQVRFRLDNLTKPPGSLGRLEEFVVQYCLCKNDPDARFQRKSLRVFAADHGITAEGVAPYPKEVTVQMVQNMLAGGAAVTVMCRQADVDYRVVDMGVDGVFDNHPRLLRKKVAPGTLSFLDDCAMTRDQCVAALSHGAAVADTCDTDIVAVGEMGIGNTSSASALTAVLLGREGEETVGSGTGADGTVLEQKQHVVDEAVRFHRSQWDGTVFDALRRVGGFEIAGMTGFILGCAQKRIPVVIDGFIATAAALCAIRTNPEIMAYLFFGHVSDEQFHHAVLNDLQAEPILHLGMRLGEGTGAVLAIQILQQALACYHSMATFSSAGVTNR